MVVMWALAPCVIDMARRPGRSPYDTSDALADGDSAAASVVVRLRAVRGFPVQIGGWLRIKQGLGRATLEAWLGSKHLRSRARASGVSAGGPR